MYYDPQAAFYGGYDRTNLARRPLLRISWMHLGLGFAVLVLAGFVAADALAISLGPATVTVTSITWTADETELATMSGLTLHGGQTFTLSLTCASLCYPFVGATVNAPFSVVGFTTELQPIQFTNVTVRAPTSGYDGMLGIALIIGPVQGIEPTAH